MTDRNISVLRGLASVAFGLLCWEAVARLFFVAAVLPPPSAIFLEMVHHAGRGTLGYDVYVSVQRVLVGFLTGSALGIALGLAG